MNRPTRDLSSTFGTAAAGLRPARRRRRAARGDDRGETRAGAGPRRDDSANDTTDRADDTTGRPADTTTPDTGTAATDDTPDGLTDDDGTTAGTDEPAGTETHADADHTDDTDDTRSGAIPTDDRTDHRTHSDASRANGRSPAPAGSPVERNGRPEPRRTRTPGRSGAPDRRTRPPRPRYGEVRLRDARQLDFLILAVVEGRPENGRVVHETLRKRSDGVFQPSLQGTYHRLHRLKNDRLITLGPDRRHYRLTPLGERILAARRREWAAFAHGVDRIVGSAGS
ncbi:PadR family transcriptional regulator [Pseudonocardia kujensis]|uniref:PadR family transcriptional regulator n=1 Tax=Pseudonocardia kujensis TaxID=1128675 RepID=UPI001E3BE1E7|nr:PadR family transcriptional regulator [Pseudonocardia kujensis]MCE0764007.1 PadR family transcriptional regulator [Pseudonocardia kujensis]